MKIELSLNRLAPEIDLEQEEVRCRQLLRTFVALRFTEALIEKPEIQKAFIEWLETRDSKSSNETQRWELRRLRAMAEKYPRLSTLEEEAERVLLDTRNVVTDKSTKAAISRMIDEDFLKRMRTRVNEGVGTTDNMKNAFLVFSATLMTGLRSTEWANCELIEADEKKGRPARLIVQTAKTKKTDPEPRELILEDFAAPHLNVIRAAIEAANSLTSHQFGHLSTSLRKVAAAAVRDEKEESLLPSLDLGSARKMFAVESLRENRTKRAVAGALGHTTIVNLRWYAQGDIHQERGTRYPLAKISHEAEMRVRDTLKEYTDSKKPVEVDSLDALDTPSN
jgi:hypothetical protein